ncbi:MAG: ATP-grasp domain-containing protein [Propioniciclava sp.]
MSAPERTLRVLVTGVGGPAAIGFMHLASREVEFIAADIDPHAAGLYMVPPDHRVLLPRGEDPTYVEAVRSVCREFAVDVIVPTVDVELLPLARARDTFAADGVEVICSPERALEVCLDKALLVEVCAAADCPVPATEVLTPETAISYPMIVKPRGGSGSRGVTLIARGEDLVGVPLDGSHLIQEYLPGEELSVDVFVRANGWVVAVVPRVRDKVDSGVAVAGRTVRDLEAMDVALQVAKATGVRGIANIQLRRRSDGTLALLEVNPRLPGSLSLTAAAGANLIDLALAEVLGEPIPDRVEFTEVALVRHLADIVVPMSEYTAAHRRDEVVLS